MPNETIDKVRWEIGSEMLTPIGSVEIVSDEGHIIGWVMPKYAEKVAAVPYMIEALSLCFWAETQADHDVAFDKVQKALLRAGLE